MVDSNFLHDHEFAYMKKTVSFLTNLNFLTGETVIYFSRMLGHDNQPEKSHMFSLHYSLPHNEMKFISSLI